MKKVTLQGHKIEIYDSIDELPIVRFQIYNKYLLLDCGIGSDMESVDDGSKEYTDISRLRIWKTCKKRFAT